MASSLELKLAAQSAAVVTTGISSSSALTRFLRNVDVEITPTHFFDPGAAESANQGTYANPWNSIALLQSYINGHASGFGMRIGLKRGSVLRGAFNLTGLSGNDDCPVVIGPYGDAQALPQIVGGYVKADWVLVAGEANTWQGVPLVTDTSALETEIYECGERLIRVPQQTTLALTLGALAAAASGGITGLGYSAFFNGAHYIIPASGNPNLGQIECASETLAFNIDLADAADAGHLQLIGLHARMSRNWAFGVYPHGVSAGHTGINITVEQCAAGQSGIDSTNNLAIAASGAAFSIGGSEANQVNRMSGLTVRHCFAHQALNNALELMAVDGVLVQGNESHEINGCSVVENFAACSNVVVTYNRGHGDVNAWLRAVNSATSARSYQKAGIWQSGLPLGGSTVPEPTGTVNIGNVYAFNYVEDAPLQFLHFQGGACKFHHNTLVRRVPVVGEQTFLETRLGAHGGANAFEFSNNLCVDLCYGNGMRFVDLWTASTIPVGDRNVYSTPLLGAFYIDNGNLGLKFDGAGSYRAALAATPLDQSSYANFNYFATGLAGSGAIYHHQAQVDTRGRPTQGAGPTPGSINVAIGNGTTSTAVFNRDSRVDYSRDIDGRPMSLTAPSIGCY
ncbi:MAG TPA: hypothetical protein VGN52_09525, partial [Burkholderiales bacterium]